MPTPPSHELSGGADERRPVGRPASEPAPGGAALVAHLVDRLARTEQDLRAAQAAASSEAGARALLRRAARHVAERDGADVADLLRLALPRLGDWCIVERMAGDAITRSVVAVEQAREIAAAPLADASRAPLAMLAALHGGGLEPVWIDGLPDAPAADVDIRRALDALGEGPVLLVPVRSHGRLVASLALGHVAPDARRDDRDLELAADLAEFVALAFTLRTAEDAVEEASRARSEFLTMMSHELRTPLNAIAGYAQLLEMDFRGPLNEGQREAVGRILRGQEHLLELVDAVLTFTRLTSGRLALDSSPVSASTLLDLAADPLRRELAARSLRLEVAPCAPDVQVLADRDRAAEVLRHLLSNAAKFTDPGGMVSLACECSDHAVRFLVTDTGRGIPAAKQDAIFQPFVQAERGHTRPVDGSGLGLAIGRELAERMGGTLRVTSEVGVGSRFALTLPRAVSGTAASIDRLGGPG